MISKRKTAVAFALCAGLSLASCAGTGNEDTFSAYVADHWPHWAGGMPADVPPRPGAPGYQEFIAHGQADQAALPPAGGANAPANGAAPVFQTAPSPPAAANDSRPVAQAATAAPAKPAVPATPAARAAPAAPQPDAEESTVIRGGLY